MDIDIDVSDNKLAREILNATRASIIENGELKPHIVGLYFQNIPKDKMTNFAAIPYDLADEYGYGKIDILNLSFLENFTSKEQIRKLLKRSPTWKLLADENVISKLFHLSKHEETLKKICPSSIEELADTLALIRPNKKHLISKYIKNKIETRKELYTKVDASDLRKSHAIPYALIIVLQLHLIEAGII
jgi:DNA polymerase III alpha subunit